MLTKIEICLPTLMQLLVVHFGIELLIRGGNGQAHNLCYTNLNGRGEYESL
jgi:hypothetical protein